MFRVGQKVVCVDAGSRIIGAIMPSLVKGKMYTVIGIYKNPCCGMISIDVGLKSNILLQGCICGSVFNNWHRCVHNPNRFRPIDEQFGERIASEIEEEINQEELVKV